MGYETRDELKGFRFDKAQVGDIRVMNGVFHIVLDNVMILPENSCNRDIRMMRCNELLLTIESPEIMEVVEEGYKLYDADGRLREEIPDRVVEADGYTGVWEQLPGGNVYSIDLDDNYKLVIDGVNERTYGITLKGTADTESWERFLNI